jgi:hypothetical protein
MQIELAWPATPPWQICVIPRGSRKIRLRFNAMENVMDTAADRNTLPLDRHEETAFRTKHYIYLANLTYASWFSLHVLFLIDLDYISGPFFLSSK